MDYLESNPYASRIWVLYLCASPPMYHTYKLLLIDHFSADLNLCYSESI